MRFAAATALFLTTVAIVNAAVANPAYAANPRDLSYDNKGKGRYSDPEYGYNGGDGHGHEYDKKKHHKGDKYDDDYDHDGYRGDRKHHKGDGHDKDDEHEHGRKHGHKKDKHHGKGDGHNDGDGDKHRGDSDESGKDGHKGDSKKSDKDGHKDGHKDDHKDDHKDGHKDDSNESDKDGHKGDFKDGDSGFVIPIQDKGSNSIPSSASDLLHPLIPGTELSGDSDKELDILSTGKDSEHKEKDECYGQVDLGANVMDKPSDLCLGLNV